MNFARFHSLFGLDDLDGAIGRAIVRERYATLRRQIPVVYLLALVNLSGLELATTGRLSFGLNLPTLFGGCALFRIAQWRFDRSELDHATMRRRLDQTSIIAAILCMMVCARCVFLLQGADDLRQISVTLFGGFTAIGVAYGLGSHPVASRLPLIVLALPLAGMAFLSSDWLMVGASVSLAVVTLLVLRLLSVHNSQFTDLVRSRALIAREQQAAEAARQEAVVAATTDFLTGLPNRRAFVAALDGQLAAGGCAEGFAVGVVDLDRFKSTNDTFGHATGDALLEAVAERLRVSAGREAVVARLGGDEFGILLPGICNGAGARAAGQRILDAVNRPVLINGRHFAASACCGFAILGKGKSSTPSRVLAEADLALYRVKVDPLEEIAVFEPNMEADQRRRAQIERALQQPRVHENIFLVYQPILSLDNGRVVANEALARWTDEELGEVSPSEFVPIAEQLHLIGGISHHLMMRAFAEAVQWPDPIRLSFNLSAVQLCSAGSADAILEALKRSNLPTGRLQVEVTETALLADVESARENLARLRSAGVTIVLDDFGAGYASIGYLKELRFDQIKLDGGLVTAAQDNSDGERLLAAVIGLCHALGVSTVAEHVENEQQLRLLQKLGCAAGQGFWLQPPMPAARARDLSRASVLVADPPKPGANIALWPAAAAGGQ